MKVQCTRKVAFGNGPRPAGFTFATIEIEKGEELAAVVEEVQLLSSSAKLPKCVKVSKVENGDDITNQEVVSAFRSLGRTTNIEMPAEESDTAPDDPGPKDWLQTSIASVKVVDAIKKKLTDAGVNVVADLDKFENLQEQAGLTEKQEEALKIAIAAIQPPPLET